MGIDTKKQTLLLDFCRKFSKQSCWYLKNSLYRNTSTGISCRREITMCIFKKTFAWQGFDRFHSHVFHAAEFFVGSLREVGGGLFGKLWQVWGGLLQEGDGGLYMVSWCQQLTGLHFLTSTARTWKDAISNKEKIWPNMFEEISGLVTCLHVMLFTQNCRWIISK